jgi:hypothetical protein
MKIEHANHLEVNFLTRAMVDDLDKLDRKKLWMMEADAVVENWVSSDGLSWFLRYSNGWVIQGGVMSTSTQQTTVTLPTPFSNTNYTALAINYLGGNASNYNPAITQREISYITWNSMIGDKTQSFGYMAMGMGA